MGPLCQAGEMAWGSAINFIYLFKIYCVGGYIPSVSFPVAFKSLGEKEKRNGGVPDIGATGLGEVGPGLSWLVLQLPATLEAGVESSGWAVGSILSLSLALALVAKH